MQEEWKDVAEYEGMYQVSNLGRVKSMARKYRRSSGIIASVSERILRPCFGKSQGYHAIFLSKPGEKQKSKTIHILVAAAFIGKRPEGCDVMHLDGSKDNNRVDNLRYGSRSCNMAFTVDHGTSQQGERHHRASLTDIKVRRIREFRSVGISCRELGKTFGVAPSVISMIATGKSWGHIA